MSDYTQSFISFSEHRIKVQGDEIRRWANSGNPLLAQTCREIIEAAKMAGGGR